MECFPIGSACRVNRVRCGDCFGLVHTSPLCCSHVYSSSLDMSCVVSPLTVSACLCVRVCVCVLVCPCVYVCVSVCLFVCVDKVHCPDAGHANRLPADLWHQNKAFHGMQTDVQWSRLGTQGTAPPHTHTQREGQHNTHHTFCNVSSRVGFNWKPPEGVLCEPVFLDFTHSEQERVIVPARGGGGEEVNSLSVVSTLSSQGRVVDHA